MATSKLTPFDGQLDDEQPASTLTPFTGQLDGEKPRTRGLFEAVNDNVIEFANAAAGGVSALANFVKPGNAVSGFIDENIIKAGEAKQSDVVQGAKRQLSEGLQNAQGIGEEVGAVGSYVLNNPLLAASQAAGSFALPGGAVKGAGAAAKALGAGAKGIETAGRVGGIAAGAAMAGGDAAGTAYDLASKAGATEDQAIAAGRQASVIPSLVGGVTGAFGAERLLAGAKGFGGNALSRGLKSGLSEAGQEAVEEGVTQFEGQRAAMPYDESIDPTKGVAGAAAMGGIMGFGPGAVLGAMGDAKPSQQMGIDPNAGPLSRAAASAVDSQPTAGGMGFNPDAGATTVFPDGSQSMNSEMTPASTVGGSITGTAPESLMGRASDPLAAQIMERRQQEAVDATPAQQSEPVPLEQRSLDELRQAFRSAQDPAIRKTLAAEIRKRREAIPDPLTQPQQEISLEPQAVETQQGSEKEQKPSTDTGSTGVLQQPVEQATEQATKELGQPLTDTGTNMLSRGADPLQSIIQGQADARRTADELRGTAGASTVPGGDITPSGVESHVANVRSGGRDDDAGAAQPDANGVAGRAVGSAAEGSAALRPEGWRTTAIKAGKVARSLGLDPKGKRLKEIVAEIDAVDAGSGVAANPVSREQAIRDAWRKEPRTIGKWTPISVEAEGQKADMLVNQKRAGGDKDGALHVVNIRMGKMLKDMEREPIAYTFRLTADNRLVEEGIPTVATPGQIAAWKGAGFALDDKPANVQNTPSSTAGTEAQAAPVEARAPEGGNAAADTGVSAAPGAGDVQADGVKTDDAPTAQQLRDMPIDTKEQAKTYADGYAKRLAAEAKYGQGRFIGANEKPWSVANADLAEKNVKANESAELNYWQKPYEEAIKEFRSQGLPRAKWESERKKRGLPVDAVQSQPATAEESSPVQEAAAQAEKPAEDDAFMGVKKDEPRNLVAMHNLTSDNLLYADSIGGIPVPSIGITKIDSPFNGFGEVTLIAPSSMVDPEQGTPVFDRDAWTARFPTMNFKKVKAKVADAFYERMKPADGVGDDGGQFLSQLWEEMRNASVQRPDKIADLFRRYNAPKMLYANELLGKEIKVPMRAANLSSPAAEDKQLQAYWKKNGDRLLALEREMSGFDFSNSTEYKALMSEIDGAVRRYAVANDKADRADSYVEMFLPDGQLGPGGFNRLRKDFEQVGTKEVDGVKLSEAVRKAVPDNDPAYQRWVKSLVEPLFEAPTITVRGKEVAPTLENIVDAMTVGATAGAEKSLTFGPGKTAAMLGKRFKSMAEIKADRDRVVSQDQESEGKKATEAILDQYRAKATAFFKGTDWRGNIDTWAANDASMEALAKAGKAGGSNADIRQALVRAGFKQVDQATVDLASESIKALRNAATDYFEAKPQRAVKLSEFRAAVVPKGVSQEVKDVLTKNGIEVVEYNKKTEGARDAAIQKTAKRVDKAAKDILFMGDKAKTQRQGTPVDRAIMDMAGEGREANEILSFIAKSSKSPYRRQLAQKLLATGANPAVSMGGEMGGGAGFRFLAKYSRKNHEVTLSEAAADRAEQIFLHETVHSATLLALDKGGLIATQMRRLAASVYKDASPEMRKMYGLVLDKRTGEVNVGEFVAEAFTNPDFQKALKGMKADNGSLWDRLVNIVRRILGMEPKEQDALSAALDLGAKVMRENMPLRAARSFRAEDGPAFAGSMNGMPDNQAPGPQGDAQQGADTGKRVAEVKERTAIRDEAGLPLRLYHGSERSFSQFDIEEDQRGVGGIWFTDSKNYAYDMSRGGWDSRKRGAGGQIVHAYLDVRNPYEFDVLAEGIKLADDVGVDRPVDSLQAQELLSGGNGWDSFVGSLVDDAKRAGHDALVIKNFNDARMVDSTAYVVFDQKSIAIDRIETNDQSAPDTGGADDAFFGIADAVEQIGKQAAVKPVVQALNDTFKVRGKIHWWHKTVGTPFNLAERVPEFKRVFNSVQDFINSVSFYGAEAAAMAPKIIPKLESWKDLGKSPIKAEDNKAIATPIFEGTLSWRRGKNGTPVRTDDVGDAGIVWTDDELRSMFKLNDEQIGLYREFRAATDKSLTDLALSDILQFAGKDAEPIKDTVMGMSLKEGSETVSRYLKSLAEGEDKVRKAMLFDTANSIKEKADKAQSLMDRGYAPLQRFGRHTLYATNDKGEQLFFGMYEDRWAAARAARQMREQYPGATVEVGMMSEQSYKMFQGISPETLELFGTMLGLDPQADGQTNEAFQTYLKLAKSNRSALKRLIERKGISGYSEDASRVLASFIYSNARQTASNLHVGEIMNGVNDIPRNMGEAKDAAVKLARYTMDPQEEAQAIRGLLFAQYLGGSIASAAINALQPAQVTFPYLSQFVGAKKSASLMTGAVRDAIKKSTGDPKLDAELRKAEEEGIVSPQEIFQLMAQAQGKATLKAGDGTKAGDAMAAASNTLSRLSLGWGKVFSIPEQFNRRTTFIAAYRTAKETGEANPYEFAKQAVKETQLVYNKGNRPEWARGTIGALAFTFKTYSISYVELLQRMAASGPEGRRAALLMVGVLFLMAGAGGLPGVEDAEDVIDGIAQRVFGLNFQTRQKRQEWLADTFGEGGARFIENGLSGLPWSPTDVSGRLGLGNLIPGTGVFVKKQDYGRDVAELAGPAADMTKRFLEGAGLLLQGEFLKAGEIVSPTAVRNMIQGGRMLATDQYTDTKGRKVIDTTPAEGITKLIGFQPADVARVQEATGTMQRMIALNKIRESEIADKWAKGLASGDAEQVQEARDELRKWNESNPESPIRINMPQLFRRVRSLKEDKATRIARTAPKEIRQDVRRALEQGQ